MTATTRRPYWRKDGDTALVRDDYRIERVEVTRSFAQRGVGGTPTYRWKITHKGAPIGTATKLSTAKALVNDHEGGA